MHSRNDSPSRMVESAKGAKRRRLSATSDGEPAAIESPASLYDLPRDLLVFVLEFLPLDDLGNVSVVSRRFSDARNDASLDQTRAGTIRFQGCLSKRKREPWSACLLLHEIVVCRWNSIFQGNRTKLRIVGLDSIESSKMAEISRQARYIALKNVTSLDISICPKLDPDFRQIKNSVAKSLALILPNLRILDFSYVKVTESAVDSFAKHCPNLEIFRWEGSDGGMHLNGQNLTRCQNLREVYLSKSRLYCSIRRTASYPLTLFQQKEYTYENSIHVLSSVSGPLERVSLKGSTWYSWDISICDPMGKCTDAPIPQSTLMRFVESTPTLRWFESDLTSENVKRLSERFPNVVFC